MEDLEQLARSESGWEERFSGTARLYGTEAVQRFRQAKVAVIGLGGVGSWAAEALVRSGVGELELFDLDDICVSNTNRQLHTTVKTIGQLKCDVLAGRMLEINPLATVTPRAGFVTRSNVESSLAGQYDFIIDAIDVVKHKAALLAHCGRHKIPVATAGAAGGLDDPLQLKRTDLSVTYHDALLAKTRKLLRQEYGFPVNTKRRFGIPAVFSAQQALPPQASEICAAEDGVGRSVRLDCSGGYGASVAVTAAMGMALSSIALARLARD